MKEKDIFENINKIMISSPPYELYNYCIKSIFADKKLYYILINELKKYQKYNLIINKFSLLLIPKNTSKDLIVISSHFDNVYKKTFIREEKENFIGTFDNSIGVLTNLWLIKQNMQDVIFAFTDCEETTREGICEINAYLSHLYKIKKYIILDVTEESVKTSTTIENSYEKLNFKHKDVTIIDNKLCGYDEARFLLDKGVNSYSICCVTKPRIKGENCHSENGSIICKQSLKRYINNVKKIIDIERGKNE